MEAERVMVNGRRLLAAHPDCDKPGRLRAMLDDLETLVGRNPGVIPALRTRMPVTGEAPNCHRAAVSVA